MEALKGTRYTYSDYCTWPDDERWEIIDGKAFNMVPAPNVNHQDVSGDLYFEIKKGLREKNRRTRFIMRQWMLFLMN